MSNTFASMKPRQNGKLKFPALPWPPPAHGDLEVARWSYGVTMARNLGDWVYVVHFFTEGGGREADLCLRGMRFREDYLTKRHSDPSYLNIDMDLRFDRKLKSPPGNMLADFKSFELRVWERAQDDQRRFDLWRVRVERRYDW